MSTQRLLRSNDDKRKVVAPLLGDREWSRWSGQEIARHCQVDHNVASRMRRNASGAKHQMRQHKVRRRGTFYRINVTIGDLATEKHAPGNTAVVGAAFGPVIPMNSPNFPLLNELSGRPSC